MAANYRYNVYRSITDCPITSLSQATKIAQALNDSAILNPEAPHPWLVGLRTNGTNAQSTIGAGPLTNPSGITVHTAVASQSACYAVVTHDITGGLGDSSIASISSTVSETIAALTPIMQANCAQRGHGNCISGALSGLLFRLPGSGGAPPPFGELWALWGDSAMGFQDGVQETFSAYQDNSTFGTPMVMVDHRDVKWWDTGLVYNNYASLETYNFGYQYLSHAQQYTQDYFSFIFPWLKAHYNIDQNNIIAFGTSMGGFGTGNWSLRETPRPFSLAIFYHPVWYWNDDLPSMQQHILRVNMGNETLGLSPVLYSTQSNTPAWVEALPCSYDLAPILHSMGRTDITTGPGDMWTKALTVANALATCHFAESFTWNNLGHGSDPSPLREFPTLLNIYRKNLSYPAFTGFSLDDNPCATGSLGNNCVIDYTQGACNSGDNSCHINQGWSWSGIEDSARMWQITITNSKITGLETATAELTPRNTQNFKLTPGEPFTWTATGGQHGSGVADAYGLATISAGNGGPITFTSGATVVTIVSGPVGPPASKQERL